MMNGCLEIVADDFFVKLIMDSCSSRFEQMVEALDYANN